MDIKIRRAETLDVPAISDLLRSLDLFPLIRGEDPVATQERVHKQFARCILDDSHFILVAQTSSGEIVGYCAVHWLPYLILAGSEGYISELFINEEYRGRGIGGLLLEEVKAEARNQGCSRLMLLNMRKRDSYQRQFYAKHGWEERPDAANFIFHLSNPT